MPAFVVVYQALVPDSGDILSRRDSIVMAENASTQHTLGEHAAFQLANVTKTVPQYGAITPRWLVRLLDWKPLEAGTLRVNRVKDEKSVEVLCDQKDEHDVPASYINYEEKPREYTLSSISTVLDVQTRVSDLFSSPFDQIKEQLRLTIETVKERQESELINNQNYGLLKMSPPRSALPRERAPPRPMISMNSSAKCGKNLRSSWHICGRSPLSGANAHVAACRLRP